VTETIARQAVFAPLQVEGAVERIVRRIGEAVGSGVLAEGERLPPEAELAAMLEVAPMTLRQALAVLRDAGVLETRRGRGGGSFVASATVGTPAGARVPAAGELRELTDWRRAVSGEAAALAAERATDDALGRIADAAGAVESDADAFAAYRLADSRFHLAIAEAAGSSRLVTAETAIQAELGEILAAVPGPEAARRASSEGHAPLLAALAARDPAAARAALERHVEATHDWVVGLRLGRLS
jgi:GntR family transcriptional regulator, transcriptional repressor for pyruvate dehydrogenase complex